MPGGVGGSGGAAAVCWAGGVVVAAGAAGVQAATASVSIRIREKNAAVRNPVDRCIDTSSA